MLRIIGVHEGIVVWCFSRFLRVQKKEKSPAAAGRLCEPSEKM